MTFTLWKITREVAAFEDDRQVGWDLDSYWYATTKGDDDRTDLLTAVAEMNDCDVRVDAVVIMKIPTYDLGMIVNLMTPLLPPEGRVN